MSVLKAFSAFPLNHKEQTRSTAGDSGLGMYRDTPVVQSSWVWTVEPQQSHRFDR
jgi:hypothetical protein